MEIRTVLFKGKEFKIAKGQTHPDYSFDTFDKEEHEFRDKYWNIKEGDVVMDIGSSYGSYALTACAVGAEKVYAFEPEKTVFVDLVQNIKINNWENKCIPMNIGIWSSESVVDMKKYAPHWPEYTITSLYNVNTVDCIAAVRGITKLDWIKLDVEGAEIHALRGALSTIERFKPNLIIECHTFLDAKIDQKCKNLLSAIIDYDFEDVKNDTRVMLIGKAK
jgi:FkbM family methyltransferase